jgi:hypothetical protein
MSFAQYPLTHAVPGDSRLSSWLGRSVPAGAYADGLLSIVREKEAEALTQCWTWLLGDGAEALVVSGFGDIFAWSPMHGGVVFVDVQRGETEGVGADVSWVVDDFLVAETIQEYSVGSLTSYLGILGQTLCPRASKR